MEKDSHYYVIYLMSLAAGLDPGDAYNISYSSQYVDDSTDGHEKILLDKEKNRYKFEPIRTAHNGFESIGVDVQQKIYYPFHFLPGLKGSSFEQQMVTQEGEKGELFNKVITEALNENEKNPFRIGISLHVLADSYSHGNFSGLWTWSNDVNRVNYIPASRNWFRNLIGKLRWHFKRGFFAAAPPIGHSNAYTFPDIPYLNWKYLNYMGELIPVSNNLKFVMGFLDLYGCMIRKYAAQLDKSPRLGSTLDRENEELRQKLWEGVNFCGSLKKRCSNWKTIIRDFVKKFNDKIEEKIKAAKDESEKKELKEQKIILPDSHLSYKKNEWENSVIKKVKKFFLFDSSKRKLKVTMENFMKSPFYGFHEAARDHRVSVLELLQKYLYKELEPVKEVKKDLKAVREVKKESISMISSEIIEKTRKKKILEKF